MSSNVQKAKEPKNNNRKKTVKKKYKIEKIIVAIDAGHGGKDPGAIGISKVQEKDITFKISKQLEHTLNKSKLFKVIMIRNGNYYVPISKRTKIAKKNHANVLISIHTNSSANSKTSGLSIWVLSKRKINSEVLYWPKKNIKNKKNSDKDQYNKHKKNAKNRIKSEFLDFQSHYVQKSGYIIATNIIKELKHVKNLHKTQYPKNANFGILKSPYFPSILIETGFISNQLDEKKLKNKSYQKIIANSIYRGLKKYFFENFKKIYKKGFKN
ncbi:MAG: N-acetylmuramoyl-L-alanine amidase [Buchnera aphidicola (Schlechtendalia chinensis)]